MLLRLTHVSPRVGFRYVAMGSLAAGGEVRVELGLKFGPIEPKGLNRVAQVSAAAGIIEFTRQDEGGDVQCSRIRCNSSR